MLDKYHIYSVTNDVRPMNVPPLIVERESGPRSLYKPYSNGSYSRVLCTNSRASCGKALNAPLAMDVTLLLASDLHRYLIISAQFS